MTRLSPAAVLVIALGSASVGHAETPRPLVVNLADAGPALDLTMPATPRAQSFAQSNALRAAGIARTALDHRFSRDDEVVGSLGFLCGLHENVDTSGGARAYGSDPNGRFLGAKLSFAFR